MMITGFRKENRSMVCKNCNHEIPPGCLFCMNCGAKADPADMGTGTGSGAQTGPQNEETILNLTRQLQDASARIGHLEQQLDQALQEKQKAEKRRQATPSGVFFSFALSALCFCILFLCSSSALYKIQRYRQRLPQTADRKCDKRVSQK